MNNRLENTIRQMRGSFDTELLPEGHTERFAQKLGEKEIMAPKYTPARMLYFKIAVAAMLAIGAIITATINFNATDYQADEVSEVLAYYSSELTREADEAVARIYSVDEHHRAELQATIEHLSRLDIESEPGFDQMTAEQKIHLIMTKFEAHQGTLDNICRILAHSTNHH